MIVAEKRILMLGGTGTLSRTIAEKANDLGWNVSVFNRGHHNHLLPRDITKIKGDFYSINDLKKCFDGKSYDVVIDFLSRRKDDIERVFPVLANKCSQYVFISSSCVFRRSSADFPLIETSAKPNTDWTYNVEKYEAEQCLIQLIDKDYLCRYTIVRPYITYDEHRIPIAIAPKYEFHRTIIERIRHGKPMFVIDDGSAISTVTYVDDFAKAVLGLLLNQKAFDEDFNVVGDFSYTHKKILEALYYKIGVKPNIISVPRNEMAKYLPNYSAMILGDRGLDAFFDNRKLKNAVPSLHFEYDLDRGLEKILAFYNENGKNAPIDYQYDGQIDRMLRKTAKIPGRFCKYADQSGLKKYLLYSLLPFKLAKKLNK